MKTHLALFPPRIRHALGAFPHMESVWEIRLRRSAPLSLTTFQGNVPLDEEGKACEPSRALKATADELRYLLGSFCCGSVYRYFDQLREGYAVDEEGWRMGVALEKEIPGSFLPERIAGINLRIPRSVPQAALPILKCFRKEGLFSLLIFSPPGEGKTTMLRSLAQLLSQGTQAPLPLRIAVVDERRELFPTGKGSGLTDVLSGYKKAEGIELATRLFSPQMILCDEIGNQREADALLDSCSGGCYVTATAHAADLREALNTPYLASLIRSGRFRKGLFLKRSPSEHYEARLQWEVLA